jgi:PAS domain S-box-containing protein
LAIVGLDGRLRRANPIHEAVLGFSIEELLQTNYLELIHPDDLASGTNELEKIARGESINYECRIRCKNGSYKLLSVRATPLPDSGLFFCASRDLTARRATEEKLRESEDRFRHLVDNASEIIYQTDAYGQIEIYNPTARKVFGYTKQELRGKHYLDFVAPSYRRRAAVFYFKQYKDKVHNTCWEVPVVTKDGKEHWLAQSVQLMLEKGSVAGFQVVARDITQRKHMEQALIEARRELENRVETRTAELAQANAALRAEIDERKQVEDALRQSQQRLALHVQQTPLGVIAWDKDFRVVEWNKAAERIFGFTYQEALGTHAELIVPPAARKHVNELWNMLTSVKGGQRSTNENITKDGRTIVCDWYNTPLINSAGHVIGVASLVSDITDRVRAEEGLRRAHSELEARVRERTAEISKLYESLRTRAADLEAVNKELEAFSYSVSHDLRAPLRAIDGFARIILEDYSATIDESGRRYLNIICKSTTQMGQLIDDLLAFSRLGRQPMTMAPIDMDGVVKSLLEDFKDLVPQRNIEFISHSLPPANGDRSMIRQVLMNLLSNAVKFSKFKEKAVIEIGATKENSRTVYYVKDNGAGFDMQYVNKIFGVFQRLHAADEFEGTGVGLAIVQRVVHRHGGDVWAKGEPGKGATFFFTLGKG